MGWRGRWVSFASLVRRVARVDFLLSGAIPVVPSRLYRLRSRMDAFFDVFNTEALDVESGRVDGGTESTHDAALGDASKKRTMTDGAAVGTTASKKPRMLEEEEHDHDSAAASEAVEPEETPKGGLTNKDYPRELPSLHTLTDINEAPRPDMKTCRHEVALPVSYTLAQVQPSIKSKDKRERPPAKEYPFVLDPFQARAVDALEKGHSVLVSAHTSAGKTVVAEYAIAISLRDKQRVIYTSPIKALSNQKYRDLTEEFGDVGLMTGDTTINPNASCLVMTTEILRSMIYRGSEVVREVAWVIYDEVHYMRDKERGVVWEESIVLLPPSVRFVFLSATIPNAREFAQWVSKIHQHPCHVVYTDYRPTPLQHYMFPMGGEGVHLIVDEKGNFRDDNFAKAMHKLGEGDLEASLGLHGGDRGVGQKGKKKEKKKTRGNVAADLVRIVEMVMSRNYDPVIIFSFSKRECEVYANSLMRKNFDFNDANAKAAITQIFKAAIENLSEDDRKLPQVEHMLPLLKCGIGIHHGGLVPLVKEVVELLFQERLLKCLFATETFAMGINMPSKTVVFSNTRKFDGVDFRFVRAGEYIQMSGRAGRRGIDDRGIVIQMIDEKMEPEAAREMLKGAADPLESSFHLGYNMLLNMLRVEEIDINFLVKMSLRQHQNEIRRPGLEEERAELTEQFDGMDIEHETIVSKYFALSQEYESVRRSICRVISMPKNCLDFLSPGRLVYINTKAVFAAHLAEEGDEKPTEKVKKKKWSSSSKWNNPNESWGVLVRTHRRYAATVGRRKKQRADDDVEHVMEVCIKHPKTGAIVVQDVELENLYEIATLRVYVGKDYRSQESRETLWDTIEEVFRRFDKGGHHYLLPCLHPLKDMKVDDTDNKDVERLVGKKETLFQSLQSHVLSDRSNKEELLEQFRVKHALKQEIDQKDAEITGTHSIEEMQTKIANMKTVLRDLGLTNAENVVQLKGRVAGAISTSSEELLVTELIFTNVFKGMEVGQIAALLSCFVFSDGGPPDKGDEVKVRPELEQPLRLLRDGAKRVAEVMDKSHALEDKSVEEYVESFRPDMMEIVFEWVNGKKFFEICKLNKKIYEGTIIRVMRRLEELISELKKATKVVGDDVLEAKFEECSVRIRRDIIFAASLYL